jgi:phage terminase large subunit-like protein
MSKDLNINLHALHPGQLEVYENRARFNVCSWGRRGGKSDLSYPLFAEICNHNLKNNLSEDMAYMAPTYKNLKPIWRRFLKVFEPIISSTNTTDYTATILDQFVIEFWSLDKPENIRGREYRRVIIDEAALILNLQAVFKLIILPTLGTLQGDAWFFSTPRGFNDFHYFYELGQNPIFTDWVSWIRPTAMNPFFPPEELEEQRKLLTPEEFAQEWEGKFVALGNSPFNTDDFHKHQTYEGCLATIKDQIPLYHICYWDIADSEDGDYTASVRLTITDTPNFILSRPFARKGKWGANYESVVAHILANPDAIHVFETEGVGGIAWYMISTDPRLKGMNMMPAGRAFTRQNKEERANIWAIELRNKRMHLIQDAGYQDLLRQVAGYPHFDNDDYIDSVSGGFLTFVYIYGGYEKLLESKILAPQTAKEDKYDYRTEQLVNQLRDLY